LMNEKMQHIVVNKEEVRKMVGLLNSLKFSNIG